MPSFQTVARHIVHWGFPLFCVATLYMAYLMGPDALQRWVISPYGFLENIPSIFLLIAIGYCISMLRWPHVRAERALVVWLLAYIVAAIYFGGEDENWGQYWLNINVPEYFLEHNKERELNLHNMSSWFNQKPRLIMELWAIVACLLVPLGWTWPKRATARFVPEILWPTTRRFIPLISLVLALDLFGKWEKRYTYMGLDSMDIRVSEIQEMLLAYLMVLYALHLWQRLYPAER